MNELLFHSSWWLLACVAAGGVGFFIAGNRRLDKNLERLGLAIFTLAVLLALLRYFFPTARERMEIRTRGIVSAVDHRDWDKLSSLLDEDTAVCGPAQVLKAGRTQIVAATKAAVDVYKLESLNIIGLDSNQTETVITVSIEVLSMHADTADHPITSSWQFQYQQSGDQWILQKITVLRIGSDTGQDFSPRLPSQLDQN
jgi:hypothetical protein